MEQGVEPSLREYEIHVAAVQPTLRTANRLTRYAVARELEADTAAASDQKSAAEAYVTALRKIKEAHTDLYDNRDHVLTQAVLDEIKQPAEDALKAFQDYEKSK